MNHRHSRYEFTPPGANLWIGNTPMTVGVRRTGILTLKADLAVSSPPASSVRVMYRPMTIRTAPGGDGGAVHWGGPCSAPFCPVCNNGLTRQLLALLLDSTNDCGGYSMSWRSRWLELLVQGGVRCWAGGGIIG